MLNKQKLRKMKIEIKERPDYKIIDIETAENEFRIIVTDKGQIEITKSAGGLTILPKVSNQIVLE